MTERNRPPARRPSVTCRAVWATEASEHVFHVSIGHDPKTGAPVEVFYADGQKTGTSLRDTVQDSCVLISLLLQHGVTPEEIGKSLATTPVFGEDRPASVVGVIVETILRDSGCS